MLRQQVSHHTKPVLQTCARTVMALLADSNSIAEAAIISGFSPLIVGSHNVPNLTLPGKLDGTIKNLRIYSRLMPATEIRQNAFNVCQTPANSSKLLFWSTLNNAKDNLVKDAISMKNGELSGFTWEPFLGVFPEHRLPTTYQYNSLNQVVQQYSPDGDTTQFFFDRIGRLTASQNKEQKENASYSGTADRYSYTKYDAVGRIIEVGEKSEPDSSLHAINLLDTASVNNWLASGTDRQVTKTVYDEPIALTWQTYNTSRKRVTASIYLENASDTEGDSTLYGYDYNGNAKRVMQHIKALSAVDAANGNKYIDYNYDLISRKVNMLSYQDGKGDQYYYKYRYDAENRIVSALSSRDKMVWVEDASYQYYLHGPLARTELGQYKVQGVDYAYTLQGWLRGINGDALDPEKEMGRDGYHSSAFSRVSRDVYAFKLGYYTGDYVPVDANNATAFGQRAYTAPSSLEATGNSLYNGNISYTTIALSKINSGQTTGYSYGYDQLNRLTEMRQHTATGAWSNSNIITAYKESISYDANGNILTYLRNGNSTTTDMDSLSYKYNRDVNGNIVNNKLNYVRDAVSSGNYNVDIDDQLADNYTYDKIGNLTGDAAENIIAVRWNAYGKIKQVEKSSGAQTITYEYNASGQRTAKTVTENDTTKTTYYIRDAQGEILSVYSYVEGGSLKWIEQHLYGRSRLGIWQWDTVVPSVPPIPQDWWEDFEDSLMIGRRTYELTNHLGNVLATISDKKIGNDSSGSVNYYIAEVHSQNDYYPFGMGMSDRKYNIGNSYRFGFNGQEKSSEIASNESNMTAEFWQYDGRIGRRWNLDPKPTFYLSRYSCFDGNPILLNDIKGDTLINPSDSYTSWMSLLTRNASNSLFKQVNKRFTIQSFSDQRTSRAYGDDLNLDVYQLNITKLPPAFTDAGQLFTHIRTNLETYINGKVSIFQSYDNGENKIWRSSNPSSSIMEFKGYVLGRQIDDAAVMTTNYEYSSDYASWTFRPVSNYNYINPFGGDKGHPLAGNREFGIQKKGSNYIFYIQGIDRLWSMQDEVFVGKIGLMGDDYFFKLADEMWRQVMTNIAAEVNKLGGEASFDSNSAVSRRIDYNTGVSEDDRKKIKDSGN